MAQRRKWPLSTGLPRIAGTKYKARSMLDPIYLIPSSITTPGYDAFRLQTQHLVYSLLAYIGRDLSNFSTHNSYQQRLFHVRGLENGLFFFVSNSSVSVEMTNLDSLLVTKSGILYIQATAAILIIVHQFVLTMSLWAIDSSRNSC